MTTIMDVAAAAGVSASTVSYVLSGKRTISPATRSRVERAIEQLGYRPHAGARALASNRTDVLGLVVPLREDVNVNVMMQFVRSVTTTARRHELDVLLLTQEEDAGLHRVSNGSLVDGLVVMDITADDPRVEVLTSLERPTVLIGVPRDPRGLSCVDFDFAGAARAAVGHLAGLGHRRVAVLASPARSLDRHAGYAERVRDGFREAVRGAGAQGVHVPCEPGVEGVRAALAAVREQLPGTTGLVVHNEAALPALLAVLAEEGLDVPGDVSVVTIAASAGGHLPRALTSLDIPALDIGRIAVEMLVARIGGDRTCETRLLAAVLADAGSTAAPGAGVRAPRGRGRGARRASA
ncbi:LacI family DNA-binding transcriptional regulator [Kineococcus indalonis]|uniref:LacI family DNA-binding transcriptional regulator n=1 Tax=Kineococcus indalonis TaxID=2696566 RepID=UPI001411BC74|nr:LacI family DNA-binding transcriptional regulator [Kineococcus indalonis]NAZ84667.1 substrate-binding domain-containing protein [Kineococcus indalonis]